MKKIFTLFLLFHVALICSAAGISKSKAIATARQFMQSRQLTADKRSAEFSSSSLTSTTLFDGTMMAVNSPSAGFVLVAGDDDNEVVLGYSDKGAFDFNNAPEHIKAWLQGYADQLKVAGSAAFDHIKPVMKAASPKASVSPLITTRWNQGEPFNNQCIMTWDGDADYKCVTGCVATAMAQVINYHKWPTDNVSAMSSYKPFSNTTVAALPAATMDWPNMLGEYVKGAYTDAQANAVAQLMRYCGQSVKMMYGRQESGAYTHYVPDALKDVFGYSKNTRMVYRADYTIDGWDEVIYGELAASRPVIYSGQSTGGGHTFVVDGYDNGYYHVNWGWGGKDDGYFLISVLNPGSNDGIGASSTADGYGVQQDAVIGIEKTNGEADNGIMNVQGDFVHDGDTYGIAIFNVTGKNNNFDMAFALETTAGTHVKYLAEVLNAQIANGAGLYLPFDVRDLNGLADGSYKLYAVSRLHGQSEWNKSFGSDLHYLSFDVVSGALTNIQFVHYAVPSEISMLGYVNNGDGLSCHLQKLQFTFKSNSAYDYNAKIDFYADGSAQSSASAGLVIPANGSATVDFDYMPFTAGDHTFVIKDGDEQIATGTLTIANSGIDATKWFAVCQFSNMEVLDGKNVMFSNSCEVKVTFYNPTASSGTNVISVGYGLTEGVIAKGWDLNISLSAGSSHSESFSIGNLGTYDTYKWIVKDKADNRILSSTDIINCRGGKAADANGNKYYIIQGSTIPPSATSVDFTYVNNSIPTSVTPSTNANCVYYLTADATTPSWLSGKNVVKGNVAETLTLTGAGDFNPAKDFTAQTVTFTKSFTGTNGTGGWNTIVLPFEATSVKNGTNDISWFTSTSDTGKDFWLYSFSGDGAGNVNFSHVSGTSVPAHTPLLIAVPDATWGAEKNLAGKPITFSATNAAIVAGKQSVANGTNYKMQGTFCSKTASDIYVLNAEGSKFQKSSSATATPFTAYFTSLGTSSSLHSLGISIDGGSPTGISEVKQTVNDSSATYNIMGQRTNIRKGIIIVNGKKVVVK